LTNYCASFAKGTVLLQQSDLATLSNFPEPPAGPRSWLQCQFSSCCEGLDALALGEHIELSVAADRPSVLHAIGLRKIDPASRLNLLLQRYTCPLNIAGDEDSAEELLMQVMTLDRPKLENCNLDRIHPTDLLLRLNLIAVCAVMWSDLRFLDALNFVYERIPITWKPGAEAARLYPSCLLLYARALARLSRGYLQ